MNSGITHIVVTASHDLVAKVFEEQLSILKHQLSWLKSTEILCVADPDGRRIGSGGGTLNAINCLLQKYGVAVLDKGKVVIIHSGGDSQRAPLHTVCGKAWATINSSLAEAFAVDSLSDACPSSNLKPLSEGYSTAFSLLLKQLFSVAIAMHPGTVIVSCSDVMLNLTSIEEAFKKSYIQIPKNCVCAIAIPERTDVAKNHGVFCVATDSAEHLQAISETNVFTCEVEYFYQKPSISELNRCIYSTEIDSGENQVLIDTGIVAFHGTGLEALINLLNDPYIYANCCGISEKVESIHRDADDSLFIGKMNVDLELVRPAMRIELYSDLLMALNCSNVQAEFSTYMERTSSGWKSYIASLDNIEELIEMTHSCEQLEGVYGAKGVILHVWSAMYEAFNACSLHVVVARDGTFGHLGTTKEWLELIGTDANATAGLEDHCSYAETKCRIFRKVYDIRPHVHSCLLSSRLLDETNLAAGDAFSNEHFDGYSGSNINLTTINSIIGSQVKCLTCPGKTYRSIVEHSVLTGHSTVGDNAVVSHIGPDIGLDLHVNPNMMIQSVPLRNYANNYTRVNKPVGDENVLIVVGMSDNVKLHFKSSGATFCNVPWNVIFELLNDVLTPDDIWGNIDEDARTLWNAKLFCCYSHKNLASREHAYASARSNAAANSLLWWQGFGDAVNLQAKIDQIRVGSGGSQSVDYSGKVSKTINCDKVIELRAAARKWTQHSLNGVYSLSDLLDCGDASALFRWRNYISALMGDIHRSGTDVSKTRTGCNSIGNFISSLPQIGEARSLACNRTLQPVYSCPSTATEKRFLSCCSKYYFMLQTLKNCIELMIFEHCAEEMKPFVGLVSGDIYYLTLIVWWHRLTVCPSATPVLRDAGVSNECSDHRKWELLLKSVHWYISQSSAWVDLHIAEDIVEAAIVMIMKCYEECYTNDVEPSMVFYCVMKHIGDTSRIADCLCHLVQQSCEYDPSNAATRYNVSTEMHVRVCLLSSIISTHAAIMVDEEVDTALNACVQSSCLRLSYNMNGVCEEEWQLVHTETVKWLVKLTSLIKSRSSDSTPPPHPKMYLSQIFVTLAQSIMSQHIRTSLKVNSQALSSIRYTCLESLDGDSHSNLYKVCVAKSPVRIDIMGGWSDTPPICYQSGGAVLNVAVKLGGKNPIRSTCRRVRGNGRVALKCSFITSRLEGCGEPEYSMEEVECTSLQDVVQGLNDPSSKKCALLKAVLCVFFGISIPLAPDASLEYYLDKYCCGDGIELTSHTNLPCGSGLGGSSILAAAALSALQGCIYGKQESGDASMHRLSSMVSNVEQLMTTGGGWQDQMGAIFPGLKLGVSSPGLPLVMKVTSFHVSRKFYEIFEARTFLIYTGKQRLAKSCLLNALLMYSVSPLSGGIHSCLSESAISMADVIQAAVDSVSAGQEWSDSACHYLIDQLGETLSKYWKLKRDMAAGSEPPFVSKLFHSLSGDETLPSICSGYGLCGAGGGGFAVVILNRSSSGKDLLDRVDISLFDVIGVEVDRGGICVDFEDP